MSLIFIAVRCSCLLPQHSSLPLPGSAALRLLWLWRGASAAHRLSRTINITAAHHQPSNEPPRAARTLVPAECKAGSGVSNAVTPADSPIFQGARDYIAGNTADALSLSGPAPAPPQTCSPACKSGTCVRGKCSCWAGFKGVDCSERTARPNQCNRVVGINLEGISDWARSWSFVDVMKGGRAWIAQAQDGSGGWGNTADVSVDAGGWVTRLAPNQMAGTMMIRSLEGHIPQGTYTVLWEGGYACLHIQR